MKASCITRIWLAVLLNAAITAFAAPAANTEPNDPSRHMKQPIATKSFLQRRIPFLVILLCLSPFAYRALRFQLERAYSIPCAGGESFTNFRRLEADYYAQTNPKWKNETIGGSGEVIEKVGCTVAGACMALSHYGIRLTPGELNAFLKTHNGYTRAGLLKWSVVSDASTGKVKVQKDGKPSFARIDAALKKGQPVLAKILIQSSAPHWVVITGKEGQDYLMLDPLVEKKETCNLSEYRSRIYSIKVVCLSE